MNKPHPLDAWLKKNKTTRKAFGDRVGVTSYYVYLMIRGKRWPSYKLATKISYLTDIPTDDLLSYRRKVSCR